MREIPKIQQQPRTQSASSIHYGYVAFGGIQGGIFVGDRRVQPEGSPYYQIIPARELIPFTNIEVPTVITDVKDAIEGGTTLTASFNRGSNLTADPTVIRVPKSARECAEELATSYEEWGFKVLYDLTGYSEEDAFAVMQAIQPFSYKISDLVDVLETAEDRINATETYYIEEPYPTDPENPISIEIAPLSAELKPVALKVLEAVKHSASLAYDLCTEIEAETRQKMEQYYSGNGGKKAADPRDRYVFNELNKAIPTRLTGQETKNENNSSIDRLANLIAEDKLKSNNIVEREEALAQKEAEMNALMEEMRQMVAEQKKKAKTEGAK